MANFQTAKKLVLEYYDALEAAAPEEVGAVLEKFTTSDYSMRSVYPFRELGSRHAVTQTLWTPLKSSLTRMQRRMDVFIAGINELEEDDGKQWVMSMGHFMGLFDRDFLGIRHTRKMVNLRYAEFSCVENGKITETGLFLDLVGLMVQAGMNPLPPSTGQYFVYPGPRMHDGLLFEDAAPEEGVKTLNVVKEMCAEIGSANDRGSMAPPASEVLGRCWQDDMIWYGPAPIGATYTIERYIEQHSGPFRSELDKKTFVCHKVRFAEGNFACFYGWPNLNNRNAGGFLGLPAGGNCADMQVVDVYCRRGDKLSENWVLIDLPWWLKQQGLDVFERTASILNPD